MTPEVCPSDTRGATSLIGMAAATIISWWTDRRRQCQLACDCLLQLSDCLRLSDCLVTREVWQDHSGGVAGLVEALPMLTPGCCVISECLHCTTRDQQLVRLPRSLFVTYGLWHRPVGAYGSHFRETMGGAKI